MLECLVCWDSGGGSRQCCDGKCMDPQDSALLLCVHLHVGLPHRAHPLPEHSLQQKSTPKLMPPDSNLTAEGYVHFNILVLAQIQPASY